MGFVILHNEGVEEVTEEEREYKKAEIILCTGWSEEVFNNATDDDIERWHKERVVDR
jgi:hypothetical protein